MNRLFIFSYLGLTCLLFTFQTALAQNKIPELWNHRVHDEAKVLSQQTIDNLEHKLKVFEDSTTNQMGILIISSLNGEIIEQYALRAAKEWKLGQADKDNGIVMVVAVDDHKMRIETGHGLEGALPDAISNRIIRNEMAPRFRRGDFDGGVTAAVDAINLAIKGEYKADGPPIGKRQRSGALFGLIILAVLGVFTYSALFTKGCAGWGLYGFLSPFYFIFPGAAFGSASSGLPIVLGYLVAFPILKVILSKTAFGQRIAKQMEDSSKNNRGSGGWSSGGGWFIGGGGGGWGGGGGGGGFSGGGGSFGGGGSSGSW
jgi:uncharacterized protein